MAYFHHIEESWIKFSAAVGIYQPHKLYLTYSVEWSSTPWTSHSGRSFHSWNHFRSWDRFFCWSIDASSLSGTSAMSFSLFEYRANLFFVFVFFCISNLRFLKEVIFRIRTKKVENSWLNAVKRLDIIKRILTFPASVASPSRNAEHYRFWWLPVIWYSSENSRRLFSRTCIVVIAHNTTSHISDIIQKRLVSFCCDRIVLSNFSIIFTIVIAHNATSHMNDITQRTICSFSAVIESSCRD